MVAHAGHGAVVHIYSFAAKFRFRKPLPDTLPLPEISKRVSMRKTDEERGHRFRPFDWGRMRNKSQELGFFHFIETSMANCLRVSETRISGRSVFRRPEQGQSPAQEQWQNAKGYFSAVHGG